MSTSRLQRIVEIAFVPAVVLLGLSWVMARRPIASEMIDASLLDPPIQTETSRQPFSFEFRGQEVRVRPVAEYSLSGLVMSHNDVESFADIYHDASSVDTKDLCLLSGGSLASDDFHTLEVWSGPFTCYYRAAVPPARFSPSDLGNNHMITMDDGIRDRLATVHRGDQVRLRGLLVDYQMGDWRDFWRKTSTRRDDDDCEVVFVESFEVVREAAPLWHLLRRASLCLLVALPVLWIALLWLSFPARRG
jgi:hypothetical protein